MSRTDEWCERRLLARIHRYTLKRLRAEIEPVAARDFLRFLFAWQRVTDETRMEGPDALAAVLGQLEGFEAPAGAWETEILPARIAGYDPAWLDDQCLAGRIAWARLRPRSTPRRRVGERGQRRVCRAGADDADHLARAPARAAVGRAVADCPIRRRPARAPAPSPISSATTAPRFSTSWPTARGCCARRSRRRWPNWWRWGWSARTASPGCARC